MKMPFFASFIIFCLFLRIYLKRSSKKADSHSESFWEREAKANSTRRKSLDNLDYITIPSEFLSWNDSNFAKLNDNFRFQDALQTIKQLSTRKIVNLTGLTNTDLKLQYGAPNITLLMDYDQNYTLLARTMQTLGEELFKAGHIAESKAILEFAISTRTDVSQSYFLLADIYERDGEPDKIEGLIRTAETINSALKKSIVRTLQESGPYSGLLRS